MFAPGDFRQEKRVYNIYDTCNKVSQDGLSAAR